MIIFSVKIIVLAYVIMNTEVVLKNVLKELVKLLKEDRPCTPVEKKTEFLLEKTLGTKDQCKDALALALVSDAVNALANAHTQEDFDRVYSEIRDKLQGANPDAGEYVYVYVKHQNKSSFKDGFCASHPSSNLMGKKLIEVDDAVEAKVGKTLSGLLDDMYKSVKGRWSWGEITYAWVDSSKGGGVEKESNVVQKKAIITAHQNQTLKIDFLLGSGHNYR